MLLETLKEKQRAAECQAEEFIKELEEEITELERTDAALEQLSHTDDHLHFLQVRDPRMLRANGALWHEGSNFSSLLYCFVDVLMHMQL